MALPLSALCETRLQSPQLGGPALWGEEVGMAFSRPVSLGIAHLISDLLENVQRMKTGNW